MSKKVLLEPFPPGYRLNADGTPKLSTDSITHDLGKIARLNATIHTEPRSSILYFLVSYLTTKYKKKYHIRSTTLYFEPANSRREVYYTQAHYDQDGQNSFGLETFVLSLKHKKDNDAALKELQQTFAHSNTKPVKWVIICQFIDPEGPGHSTMAVLHTGTKRTFFINPNNASADSEFDQGFAQLIMYHPVFSDYKFTDSYRSLIRDNDTCVSYKAIPRFALQGQLPLCASWSLYFVSLFILNDTLTRDQVVNMFSKFTPKERVLKIWQFLSFLVSIIRSRSADKYLSDDVAKNLRDRFSKQSASSHRNLALPVMDSNHRNWLHEQVSEKSSTQANRLLRGALFDQPFPQSQTFVNGIFGGGGPNTETIDDFFHSEDYQIVMKHIYTAEFWFKSFKTYYASAKPNVLMLQPYFSTGMSENIKSSFNTIRWKTSSYYDQLKKYITTLAGNPDKKTGTNKPVMSNVIVFATDASNRNTWLTTAIGPKAFKVYANGVARYINDTAFADMITETTQQLAGGKTKLVVCFCNYFFKLPTLRGQTYSSDPSEPFLIFLDISSADSKAMVYYSKSQLKLLTKTLPDIVESIETKDTIFKAGVMQFINVITRIRNNKQISQKNLHFVDISHFGTLGARRFASNLWLRYIADVTLLNNWTVDDLVKTFNPLLHTLRGRLAYYLMALYMFHLYETNAYKQYEGPKLIKMPYQTKFASGQENIVDVLDSIMFDKRNKRNLTALSLSPARSSGVRLRLKYSSDHKRPKSPSPVKKQKSPSPVKRPKSPSPVKKQKLPSPVKRPKSPSPVKKQKLPSPVKKQKLPSPVKKQKSPSPVKRPKLPSPTKKRHRSTSPKSPAGKRRKVISKNSDAIIVLDGSNSPVYIRTKAGATKANPVRLSS